MVIPSTSSSACKTCGKGELPHLRGEAFIRGKKCPGYQPEDGITKKQGLSMFSLAADAAEERINSKKK